jgi:hypothetical protein
MIMLPSTGMAASQWADRPDAGRLMAQAVGAQAGVNRRKDLDTTLRSQTGPVPKRVGSSWVVLMLSQSVIR